MDQPDFSFEARASLILILEHSSKYIRLEICRGASINTNRKQLLRGAVNLEPISQLKQEFARTR